MDYISLVLLMAITVMIAIGPTVLANESRRRPDNFGLRMCSRSIFTVVAIIFVTTIYLVMVVVVLLAVHPDPGPGVLGGIERYFTSFGQRLIKAVSGGEARGVIGEIMAWSSVVSAAVCLFYRLKVGQGAFFPSRPRATAS